MPGGKGKSTGGKAGPKETTGKPQKSHSAKAGLQVRSPLSIYIPRQSRLAIPLYDQESGVEGEDLERDASWKIFDQNNIDDDLRMDFRRDIIGKTRQRREEQDFGSVKHTVAKTMRHDNLLMIAQKN